MLSEFYMVRSSLEVAAYLCLTRLDNRNEDNPTPQESELFRLEQMKALSHGHWRTTKRLGILESPRHARPRPLVLRRHDYRGLRYPYELLT